MADKYLGREDAPFGDEVWKMIDQAVLSAARAQMTGRRILDLEGPFGLGLKFVPMGDDAVGEGISASQFIPVLYLQREFSLNKRDLANFEREGVSLDLGAAAEAAAWCAAAEDEVIFNGTEHSAGLLNTEGINKAKLSSWETVGTAANDIINAVTLLDAAGFHGPYTMALAPARYNLLYRRYPNGNTSELDHIKSVVAGGVHKAPILKKGGILMASGAQNASIVLGQDLQTGFIGPAGEEIDFYVSESLAVKVMNPPAICALEE